MSEEKSKNYEMRISLCAMSVSLIATALSVFIAYNDYQENKVANIVSLYQYLHDPELSKARQKIRNPNFKATTFTDEIHQVCSSFDFAGTLVHNGAIDQKLFFEYWGQTFLILDKRFAPIWDLEIAEGYLLKNYYKDFYWLVQESKKKVKPPE